MLNMSETIWISPDNKIKKQIIKSGQWGYKPTENCQCNIKITDYSPVELEKYASITSVIVGDSDDQFQRLLDNCLLTMYEGEIALVTFHMDSEINYSFTLELLNNKSNGLIYEWSAGQKVNLASKHKEKGVDLYNNSRYIDASCRFGKGLKLLCSIPINVDECPTEIDGVNIKEIKSLKVMLYNNLAACYLKVCDYETVLQLCKKVFEDEENNIKALYKQAIALYETHDYEKSQTCLMHLLELDPGNKAAAEKLKFVNIKVSEGNTKMNIIIKKMFGK